MRLYLLCQTQWVYSGMGVRTGLNYQSVEVVARQEKLWDDGHAFRGLRVIELELLAVDAAMREQDAQATAVKGKRQWTRK